MNSKNLAGKIRWGILSTAEIAREELIPAIQASRNGILAAIASRELARAQALAARAGIPGVYGSYHELLQDPEIDAVYIPLPNSMHLEWTLKAAEAGKHILCEKPLAMNAEECFEMEAAARKNGVKLMEAFMHRFHPLTEAVVDAVHGGELGELRLVQSAFNWAIPDPHNIRFNPALGGGALMDMGCYCVNISRTLTGTEPVEAQAYARWSASGVDEYLAGMLRFPGDVYAQFDCSLIMERRENYQAAGSKGFLRVPTAFLPGKEPASWFLDLGTGQETAHTVAGVNEYQLMVEHFAGCILEDRPPRYPVSEAAANMRAIEALYRSARNEGKLEHL